MRSKSENSIREVTREKKNILFQLKSYISLGTEFYVLSATTNSATQKTRNMVSFVAVPAVECSRITFLLKPSMALYENIRTAQNSGLG